MKKILAMVLTLVMVLSMITTVFGANFDSKVLGEAADGDTGYGFVQSVRRGALIMSGSCSISETKDNRICGYARTVASKVVDLVAYKLYYEKWDATNSKWEVLNAMSPAAKRLKDDIEVSAYHYRDTTGPGRYRVQVDHYVEHGTSTEMLTNTSEYVIFE